MSAHRRTRHIPRRSVPIAAALLTAVVAGTGLLVDAGAGSTPVVHTVPATTAGPAQEPYRPQAACRCPVRVWDDGVLVPPPAPRLSLQVCALGGACLTQDAAEVVGGPVAR